MSRTPFDHVFVLCTGRCGSATFAHACAESIDNYTSGHESRMALAGDHRLEYPTGHVEVDNRLAWFLGRLDERFGERAFYVHLQRDPEQTARSYARRRALGFLLHAWTRGIYVGLEDAPDFHALARDMVDTVTANIRLFLRGKPHQMNVQLESAVADFADFRARVGAIGDQAKADAAWSRHLNASLATANAAGVEPPGDRGATQPLFAANWPLPDWVREAMVQRLRGAAVAPDAPSASGREHDLSAQFDAIRSDFTGAPALCLLTAEYVVKIRRGVDSPAAWAALQALTAHPESGDFLARQLNLRWLVSVLDTYADHAPAAQAAGALSLSVLVNTLKLAETERRIMADPEHDDDRRRVLARQHPAPLFGGLNAFRLESGDMVRNLFARLDTVLQDEPFLHAVLQRLRADLRQLPNTLSRLAPYHSSLY